LSLVYLHEAIEERGGLERIASIAELRQAVLEGAIHRLRPKLLTEGAAIISIAPMLWATGVGAEVIRPMAAPVLGGLLIADEVNGVFLPVLDFAVQKRRWFKVHGIGFWDKMISHGQPHPPISAAQMAAAPGSQNGRDVS
jgi:Cu(I)/Ag(I) efflux system membrane protein CusA/SilA